MDNNQLFYIDTHAHMQFDAYEDDRKEVIARALEAGTWMINVGIDKETSEAAIALAEEYDEGVYAAVGLHPNYVLEENWDPKTYRKLADHPKVVAFGETGLDYYRLPAEDEHPGMRQQALERQQEALMGFMMLSEEMRLPLICHVRDAQDESLSAHDDITDMIQNYNRHSRGFDLRGVIHSFTGNEDHARKYVEQGFKIGVNGIATFAQPVGDVIKTIPTNHLLLETDCPYLTPGPHRGKRNEPSYVRHIGEEVARLKKTNVEEVAFTSSRQAATLFHKIEIEAKLPHSRKF